MPDSNNALLAYNSKSGSYAVGCKCRGVAFRWEVVATESHAKRHRAFYPHQLAISQFKLTVELKGYYEQRNFLNFLKSYSETMIYGDAQPMWIAVDSVSFARFGFPIKGIDEREQVGSMVFTPSVIFEAVTDPLDPTILNQNSVSKWDLNGTETDVKNFFYPFSRASYDTSVRPETVYDLDGPNNPGAVDMLNGVSNGAGNNLGNAAGDALDAVGRIDSGGLQ